MVINALSFIMFSSFSCIAMIFTMCCIKKLIQYRRNNTFNTSLNEGIV